MKILIIGILGKIARLVVRQLVEREHVVESIDRQT